MRIFVIITGRNQKMDMQLHLVQMLSLPWKGKKIEIFGAKPEKKNCSKNTRLHSEIHGWPLMSPQTSIIKA